MMLDSTIHGADAPPPAPFLLAEPKYLRRLETRRVTAGTPLFVEGLRRGETARIVDGSVCLYRQMPDGARQILAVLGPGHLVGSFLTDLAHCNVMALTRTRLAALAPAEETAKVAEATRHMLLRAQSHAMLLRRNAVSERVASGLLDLADQFGGRRCPGVDGRVTFTLHLTRADLADWLGLTLTSVSRGLNAFKRAGLIAFDHPKVITIRDRAGLEALAAGMGDPARRKLPQGKPPARA